MKQSHPLVTRVTQAQHDRRTRLMTFGSSRPGIRGVVKQMMAAGPRNLGPVSFRTLCLLFPAKAGEGSFDWFAILGLELQAVRKKDAICLDQQYSGAIDEKHSPPPRSFRTTLLSSRLLLLTVVALGLVLIYRCLLSQVCSLLRYRHDNHPAWSNRTHRLPRPLCCVTCCLEGLWQCRPWWTIPIGTSSGQDPHGESSQNRRGMWLTSRRNGGKS